MARLIPFLILLVAGCATVQKPPPPPPKPGPERALYTPATFDSLPGWDATRLEPSLRAFLAGCPRAPGPLINACAIAASVPVGDEAAARRFLKPPSPRTRSRAARAATADSSPATTSRSCTAV